MLFLLLSPSSCPFINPNNLSLSCKLLPSTPLSPLPLFSSIPPPLYFFPPPPAPTSLCLYQTAQCEDGAEEAQWSGQHLGGPGEGKCLIWCDLTIDIFPLDPSDCFVSTTSEKKKRRRRRRVFSSFIEKIQLMYSIIWSACKYNLQPKSCPGKNICVSGSVDLGSVHLFKHRYYIYSGKRETIELSIHVVMRQ